MASLKTDGYITSSQNGDWLYSNTGSGSRGDVGEGDVYSDAWVRCLRCTANNGAIPGTKVDQNGVVSDGPSLDFTSGDPGLVLSGAAAAEGERPFIVWSGVSPMSLNEALIVWNKEIVLLNSAGVTVDGAIAEHVSVTGRLMVVVISTPIKINGEQQVTIGVDPGCVGFYNELPEQQDPDDEGEGGEEDPPAEGEEEEEEAATCYDPDAVEAEGEEEEEEEGEGLTPVCDLPTPEDLCDYEYCVEIEGGGNGGGEGDENAPVTATDDLLFCDMCNATAQCSAEEGDSLAFTVNNAMSFPVRCTQPFMLVKPNMCPCDDYECNSTGELRPTHPPMWLMCMEIFGTTIPMEVLPMDQLETIDPCRVDKGTKFPNGYPAILVSDHNCTPAMDCGRASIEIVGTAGNVVDEAGWWQGDLPGFAGQAVRFMPECHQSCKSDVFTDCRSIIFPDEVDCFVAEDIIKPRERTIPASFFDSWFVKTETYTFPTTLLTQTLTMVTSCLTGSINDISIFGSTEIEFPTKISLGTVVFPEFTDVTTVALTGNTDTQAVLTDLSTVPVDVIQTLLTGTVTGVDIDTRPQQVVTTCLTSTLPLVVFGGTIADVQIPTIVAQYPGTYEFIADVTSEQIIHFNTDVIGQSYIAEVGTDTITYVESIDTTELVAFSGDYNEFTEYSVGTSTVDIVTSLQVGTVDLRNATAGNPVITSYDSTYEGFVTGPLDIADLYYYDAEGLMEGFQGISQGPDGIEETGEYVYTNINSGVYYLAPGPGDYIEGVGGTPIKNVTGVQSGEIGIPNAQSGIQDIGSDVLTVCLDGGGTSEMTVITSITLTALGTQPLSVVTGLQTGPDINVVTTITTAPLTDVLVAIEPDDPLFLNIVTNINAFNVDWNSKEFAMGDQPLQDIVAITEVVTTDMQDVKITEIAGGGETSSIIQVTAVEAQNTFVAFVGPPTDVNITAISTLTSWVDAEFLTEGVTSAFPIDSNVMPVDWRALTIIEPLREIDGGNAYGVLTGGDYRASDVQLVTACQGKEIIEVVSLDPDPQQVITDGNDTQVVERINTSTGKLPILKDVEEVDIVYPEKVTEQQVVVPTKLDLDTAKFFTDFSEERIAVVTSCERIETVVTVPDGEEEVTVVVEDTDMTGVHLLTTTDPGCEVPYKFLNHDGPIEWTETASTPPDCCKEVPRQIIPTPQEHPVEVNCEKFLLLRGNYVDKSRGSENACPCWGGEPVPDLPCADPSNDRELPGSGPNPCTMKVRRIRRQFCIDCNPEGPIVV